MAFNIGEFLGNQVQPALETANVYLGIVGAGASIWAAIAASWASKRAKRAADAALGHAAKINLTAEVAAALNLIVDITRLQNANDKDALPNQYDALILKWQHILSNKINLNEGEIILLEVGEARLNETKASMMRQEDLAPDYLDGIIKDRSRELISIHARLRGFSNV